MYLFKSFQDSHKSAAFTYLGPNKILLGNKKLVTWLDSTNELAKSPDWLAEKRGWYKDAVEKDGQK
ncbi:hypothetical protein [Clostridium kluyveri]|uniref:hypothetical protein n=1 Tax=Clostridium kluyveri TaxID=1534 RepID=UPI0002FB532C|nr:hypothetical protein [Clostridium kluyveri]